MINNQIISGTKLPELTNPASKTDIVSGKEVIGADGKIIKGTVYEATKGNVYYTCQPVPQAAGALNGLVTEGVNNLFAVDCNSPYSFMARQNAIIRVPIVPATLGDATAVDVASGKTFSSSAGVKVTGTATIGATNTINVACTFDTSSCSDKYYEQYFAYSLLRTLMTMRMCVIDVKDNIYITPAFSTYGNESLMETSIYVYGGHATFALGTSIGANCGFRVSISSNASVPVKNCIKTIYFFPEINFATT